MSDVRDHQDAAADAVTRPMGVVARPVGFARTFRSEWLKLWSLRGTRRGYLAALILALGTAVLLCFTIGPTTGVPLEARRPLDVLSTSLLGTDAAALLLLVVAAGTIGSEFATGMMRTTLTVSPRRERWMFAKALAVLLSSQVVGLAAGVASVLAGQAVLLAIGLEPIPMDAAALQMALGASLIVPFYSVLATAFAVVFRATAGGVGAALIVLFLPTVVGWGPTWFQANLLPLLPGEAIHIMAGLTGPDAVSYVHPLVALGTLAVWLLAVTAVAAFSLRRRDV